VRSCSAKERVPNPLVIIRHSFKHYTAISMTPFCTNLAKQTGNYSMTNTYNLCFQVSRGVNG
jgi:hypothetical protein